jgi:hypothetical protein
MGRRPGGDDGPGGLQGQRGLESVCDRVLGPRGGRQVVGLAQGGKVWPGARGPREPGPGVLNGGGASRGQPLGAGRHSPVEGTSLKNVGRAAGVENM